MLRHTETTVGAIVLAVVTVTMACCGMLMGLVRVWPKMGLGFFLAVYCAECCAVLLLNHKIESRFIKLGELIAGKPGSDRLVSKFVPNSVLISMLIFIPVMFLFMMFACNQGRWLALCILLAAFLITNAVFTTITIWLKIKACSERLEEVVSNNKESTAPTEPKKL